LTAADHAHGQGTNSQLRTCDSAVGTHRVGWYNTRRLHSAIGDVPPAELEADYSAPPTPCNRPEPPNAVSMKPRAAQNRVHGRSSVASRRKVPTKLSEVEALLRRAQRDASETAVGIATCWPDGFD
jgi:hypothetical protein